MYGTNSLIRIMTRSITMRNYYATLMQTISQLTLQRVVTTFNLEPDYFDKIELVKPIDPNPSLRGRQSNFVCCFENDL